MDNEGVVSANQVRQELDRRFQQIAKRFLKKHAKTMQKRDQMDCEETEFLLRNSYAILRRKEYRSAIEQILRENGYEKVDVEIDNYYDDWEWDHDWFMPMFCIRQNPFPFILYLLILPFIWDGLMFGPVVLGNVVTRRIRRKFGKMTSIVRVSCKLPPINLN